MKKRYIVPSSKAIEVKFEGNIATPSLGGDLTNAPEGNGYDALSKDMYDDKEIFGW